MYVVRPHEKFYATAVEPYISLRKATYQKTKTKENQKNQKQNMYS